MISTKPKCLFCISLETGCLIFGFFNCIFSGVVILALCGFLTDLSGEMSRFNKEDPEIEFTTWNMKAQRLIKDYVYVMSIYLFTITMFIFSVFLCYGVHKRSSGFVKTFLIYGIVMTCLVVTAITYFWLLTDFVNGSLMLMGCGVYSLLLLMVQRTYEIFRNEEKIRDQQQVIDSKPIFKA